MIRITEVQIVPIKAKEGLVAFASVVLDNCLYLGSIGVHKRASGNGYRITYPNKASGNRNMDIYHPINIETSKLIEEAIIEKISDIFGAQ